MATCATPTKTSCTLGHLDAADEDTIVVAVADGMGGYDRGRKSPPGLRSNRSSTRLQSLDTDDSALILKQQAYRKANESIYEGGVSQGEENMMGTTLVAGLVRGVELSLANVGDSRAYLLRAGALTQVTQDHSLIAEQVRMGRADRRGSEVQSAPQHHHPCARPPRTCRCGCV